MFQRLAVLFGLAALVASVFQPAHAALPIDPVSITVGATTTGQFDITNHIGGTFCQTSTGTVSFVVDLVTGQGVFHASSSCGNWVTQFHTQTCAVRQSPDNGILCAIYSGDIPIDFVATTSRLSFRDIIAQDSLDRTADWEVVMSNATGIR